MIEKLYNVGMYLRLSRESTNYRGEDSLSIENQQAMLSKFISMMPGWIEKRVYVDEGASGANFRRKGFQDMMEDARQGIINLVLVKDLSRFGRNYLEAGKYLEEELPALGCRFVALSDGVDTETGENDIIPFLNAINDFYVRNLSDRLKFVLTAKAKDGQKLSGAVPYGYDRDSKENTRLVVDEYAASVVKRIFEKRAEGAGYTAIAGILNKDGILPPRLYYFERQSRERNTACSDIWRHRTVKLILCNELYLGHTVAFKRKTRSYRDNRTVKRDESEWIRVENTHTPIISDDLWQTVQRLNENAKANYSGGTAPQQSLFSGLVICAGCQAKMNHAVSTVKYKSGRIAKYGSYDCRTHRSTGGAVCSWHRISENNLKALVLDHIRQMSEQIALDENRMLNELKHRLTGIYRGNKSDATKERKELEQQLYALENQLERLYEDKVAGQVSKELFASEVNEVEAQRCAIEDRLSRLNQTAAQTEAKFGDIKTWVKLIKEKSTVADVDRVLLEYLVERIEIGEKVVTNGAKTQDVRIFYKYVGLC